MSVSTEISRILTDRNTIRTKYVDLGIATSTSTLDDLATASTGIVNQGAVSATVQEGATYTIPKGYHNGSGTVSGVSGGGNYNLQTKTVTPTKEQQAVASDDGYYGLSSVTVDAIPDAYQDVSTVTATASDVLANKIIVTSDGSIKTGTMTNNGAVSKVLDTTTTSYTVPSGYHNGSGKVSITLEEKTTTPTESVQNITPTSGSVLSKVTVNAIPIKYGDASSTTVVSSSMLKDVTAVGYNSSTGAATIITGNMANNGSVTTTIDGLTTMSATIPAGYTTGGTVSLTNDIETALAAI